MLCEICGDKEATIQLTQVINNNVKKINLCHGCAADSGLDVEGSLSMTEMLLGLGAKKEEDSEVSKKSCPVCHMRFADFKKTLRLGCRNCYEAFIEELNPVLEGMHKGTVHVGKIPVKAARKLQRMASAGALKKALKNAIDTENYEEAARLRDEIKRWTQSPGNRKLKS